MLPALFALSMSGLPSYARDISPPREPVADTFKTDVIRTSGGLCLDIRVRAWEIGRNGAPVQTSACNGSPQQRFTSKVF